MLAQGVMDASLYFLLNDVILNYALSFSNLLLSDLVNITCTVVFISFPYNYHYIIYLFYGAVVVSPQHKSLLKFWCALLSRPLNETASSLAAINFASVVDKTTHC